MKTKLGLLGLLALLLLSGCDMLFDTLIEAVYKEQIDENAFGSVEVPVTIYIGTNWDAYMGEGDLTLALVPYYNASGGIVPNWGGRIERHLDWLELVDARFETSFQVQKGFASWRLFVWQPSPGNEGTILETDPSKVLPFNFEEGWGSNEVLDDYNLDSRPYVAEWFLNVDRVPSYIIDQLNGDGTGEAMSIYGAQNIDAAEALYGTGYYFSVSRYSSETFKRVREILVQRRNTDGTVIYRRSWEPEWIGIPVEDWREYDSYYDFTLSFDSLYENGDGINDFDLTAPIELAVKLLYEDGLELVASPETLLIYFQSGGPEIVANTPFRIDFEVDRSDDPAFATSLIRFILYDENWNFLQEIDSTLVDGYISMVDLRGYPSYSSVDGGRYKLRVIIDANGSGIIGDYNGDYDHFTDKELVVTTDGASYVDGTYGTVYIGNLSFTGSDYWYYW